MGGLLHVCDLLPIVLCELIVASAELTNLLGNGVQGRSPSRVRGTIKAAGVDCNTAAKKRKKDRGGNRNSNIKLNLGKSYAKIER